jgi:hypothetical protein
MVRKSVWRFTMRKSNKWATVLVLLLCFLLFPRLSYGYIDPGTGSYVIQLLIAAFVAISFGIKIFWKKIKAFLLKVFHKNKPAA